MTSPTTTTTAIIADDERMLRDQLRGRLADVWPELRIVAEAKNGLEAVELVEAHRPDVVFLDIRMPGATGVEAAQRIAQLERAPHEPMPAIVFVTAYDQYAVEAFEQGAIDYVLKPAESARLAKTVERLRAKLGATDGPTPNLQALLHSLRAHLTGRTPRYLDRIQASIGTTVHLFPIEEVLFFMSGDKYTRVQTATTEALIRKSIKELVDEVDPHQFWQIHRGTLVNVRAIASVERDDRGHPRVHLRNHPEVLDVSRSFAGLFRGM